MPRRRQRGAEPVGASRVGGEGGDPGAARRRHRPRPVDQRRSAPRCRRRTRSAVIEWTAAGAPRGSGRTPGQADDLGVASAAAVASAVPSTGRQLAHRLARRHGADEPPRRLAWMKAPDGGEDDIEAGVIATAEDDLAMGTENHWRSARASQPIQRNHGKSAIFPSFARSSAARPPNGAFRSPLSLPRGEAKAAGGRGEAGEGRPPRPSARRWRGTRRGAASGCEICSAAPPPDRPLLRENCGSRPAGRSASWVTMSMVVPARGGGW